MPSRPRKPCSYPGCPELTIAGSYCTSHQTAVTHQYDESRNPEHVAFYRSAPWLRIRERRLREFPICELCHRAISRHVHHRKKLSDRWDLRLDYANLQAACHPCHSRLTIQGL